MLALHRESYFSKHATRFGPAREDVQAATSDEFSLKNHAPFRNFLLARIASVTGSNMLAVVVGWQMYDLTKSPMDLGLVGLFQFTPALLLTFVVGQVADRFDRRSILGLCHGLLVAIVLLLIFGTLRGFVSRELLLFASLLIGVGKSFQMPTQQALAPALVPPEGLPRALAVSGSAMQFSVIVGPALGGFLYAFGPSTVYAITGVLAFLAAVLFQCITVSAQKTLKAPVTLENVFAGVRFIFEKKAVLGAISLDLFAVLLGGATALLPIFVRDVLHTGPFGLGILRSAPAVGAFGMSLYLSRRSVSFHVGNVLFSSVAIFGIATIVFAFSKNFLLSVIALAVLGAADMISVIIRQSLVQLETPDDMRGRVSAVNTIFIGASNQLGEFESGLTASLFGTVPSVALGGVGTLLVVALWRHGFPELRNRRNLLEPSLNDTGENSTPLGA